MPGTASFSLQRARPLTHPGREQVLFAGFSQHFYQREGTVRHQLAPIDLGLPHARHTLFRWALFDIDTGTIYGEYHDRRAPRNLLGFLARAWSPKYLHPMQGLPEALNVPRDLYADRRLGPDLDVLRDTYDVDIAEVRTGFPLGTPAVRQLEREALLAAGRPPWHDSRPGEALQLSGLQSLSGMISHAASGVASNARARDWSPPCPRTHEFLAWVDSRYASAGEWRRGAFEPVLEND